MTTYTNIPNTSVDQDSPVTETLMTALRDNPLAIAEGDVTAPKIDTAAMNPATAAGAVSNVQTKQTVVLDTVTGLDRIAKFFVQTSVTVEYVSGSPDVTGATRVRFSTDGGSTWGSYFDLSARTISSGTAEAYNANILDISSYNAIEFSHTQSGTASGRTSGGAVGFAIAGVVP